METISKEHTLREWVNVLKNGRSALMIKATKKPFWGKQSSTGGWTRSATSDSSSNISFQSKNKMKSMKNWKESILIVKQSFKTESSKMRNPKLTNKSKIKY